MEIPNEVKYVLEDRHDENMRYLEDCAKDGTLCEFLADHGATIEETKAIRRFLGGLDEFNPVSLWVELNEDEDRNSIEAKQEAPQVGEPQKS